MPSQSGESKFNHQKKDRRKAVRAIIQIAALAFLSVIIIRAVFITDTFEPLSDDQMINSKGFIALSYFGVDRSGSPKYISKEEIRKQLTTLKEQGFETISQQQIIDFYQKGRPLPEKALFLSFEDGRNDSSIFSQRTLEKLNYKATMFTYADKMNTKDTKFLKPNHLSQMVKSGYWELGSNGYRITYINVFNSKGQYLGDIEENKVPNKTSIEYYNHYLMDFLRDEYMIPKETRAEMEKRISSDYRLMNSIYKKHFGKMPKAYAIMHANSLYNDMHSSVESVNEKMIKENFAIHFNRDLNSYNSKEDNIYNLKRLQVAPHWPTNHLLMKIQNDSKKSLDFVPGDKKTSSRWTVTNGVGEFDQDKIILTSKPGEEVRAALNEGLPSSFTASFDLKGNVMGKQTVYIQGPGQEYVKLALEKNKLFAYQKKKQGAEQLIFSQSLKDIKWSGEDYAFNKATNYDYLDTQEGSRIHKDEYPSTLKNEHHMILTLDKTSLKVKINNQSLPSIDLPFGSSTYSLILGGSNIVQQTGHDAYSDNIYDSIIEDVTIQTEGKNVYTVSASRIETLLRDISKMGSNVVDFFINTF